MAGRPPKKGIDYAGWSVSIFDNDTKIDKLLDAHGWCGFGIYFYLCQRAYGGEGYFYQWGYDDCASTSRKMGGGIGSGTVREAVGYCLQIGLFDQGLFDRWGVLTSRGIQRRYWEVVKARDVRTVISDYWLLQDEECKGLIKLPLNMYLSDRNADYQTGKANFPAGNSNFPTQKESKVKKRKEKEIPCANRFEDFWSAYPNQQRRHLAEKAYCDLIISGTVKEDDLVVAAQNYADHVKESGDKMFLPNNFLEKCVFEDYLEIKEPEIPKMIETPPELEEEPEPDAEQLAAEGWIDFRSMSDEELEKYMREAAGNYV